MDNKIFLNRYRLSLGHNGLPVVLHKTAAGTTYRAQERVSGREVTIEILPAPSAEPAALQVLHDEAAAARQINHLNIPVLHDFGVEEGQLIYVTEYFDGPTAQAWVTARGPLSIGSVLRLAIQVTAALGAASFHRLTPRALHPGNIILVAGQTPTGDWPAIKLLHWLGPPAPAKTGVTDKAQADAFDLYRSPEQREGEKVDFASAVYSLGCTMWFLLTGAPPAPAESGKEIVRAGQEKLRGLPKIVRHLLDRMMRFNPAERPQDPVALEAYLQTCLGRVERREKIERRPGVPMIRKPRVAKKRIVSALPIRDLAMAALFLALATATSLGLSGMWRSQSDRVPVTQKVESDPVAALPNEHPVVRQDSPERMDPPAPPLAPTPMAIAHNSSASNPRHEPDAPPEAVDVAAAEPPPPSQGPEETGDDLDQPIAGDTPPVEPSLPNEPDPEPLIAPSLETDATAATDSTDPELEEVAPPRPSDTPAASPAGDSVAATTPPAKKARSESTQAAQRATPKKKKIKAVAKRSRSDAKPRRRTRVTQTPSVKRALPIPQMLVGSDKAELVGTTSDGHWILSVSGGRRVIVPPPPGYAQ